MMNVVADVDIVSRWWPILVALPRRSPLPPPPQRQAWASLKTRYRNRDEPLYQISNNIIRKTPIRQYFVTQKVYGALLLFEQPDNAQLSVIT